MCYQSGSDTGPVSQAGEGRIQVNFDPVVNSLDDLVFEAK